MQNLAKTVPLIWSVKVVITNCMKLLRYFWLGIYTPNHRWVQGVYVHNLTTLMMMNATLLLLFININGKFLVVNFLAWFYSNNTVMLLWGKSRQVIYTHTYYTILLYYMMKSQIVNQNVTWCILWNVAASHIASDPWIHNLQYIRKIIENLVSIVLTTCTQN